MAHLSEAEARRYLTFISVLFLIWGVMATVFGAISPNLLREFALDDARLSYAPACLAAGGAVGALWGGALGGALRLRRVILGFLTLGLGAVALMALAPAWPAYLAGAFLMMMLFTVSITLCNGLLTKIAAPERRTAVFGRAQAVYTFGAAVGPLIAAGLLWRDPEAWRLIYALCGLALVGLLAWAWTRLASLSQAGVRLESRGGFAAYGDVLRDSGLRWMLLAAILGGGILELTHAAFSTLHAVKAVGLSDTAGRVVYTAFTVGMFIARLAISTTGGRLRPETLLTAAGALASASALLLMAAQGQSLATFANFGLGLAAGAAFPLTMLMASARRPDLVDASVGAMILASSAGYQAASLTLGALGDAWGLKSAYWLVAVGAVLWFLVALKLRRLGASALQEGRTA
ncbi:sugar MFS transporter [Neomegalonema sp.]|uniref:MFS transporter n=1 Tax=Neomegalonema sp. TaxID=2039713 RepID=UPI0026139C56|nr:MFS transporter [Neomegalonema sp.]MDD2867081.1 MFS transporter [Neomegalonema sp.]